MHQFFQNQPAAVMIPIIFIGDGDKILFVTVKIRAEYRDSKRNIFFSKQRFIAIKPDPCIKKFSGLGVIMNVLAGFV